MFTALLLIAAIANPAAVLAADSTAEEKYQSLVEKGIFEGFTDGQARLDSNTTRAQAAKIVALILGLEENAAGASVYTDLAEAKWAEGFIGAATAAGILEGRGNGIFDPSADVTIQELAKIMVEVLGIEVNEDATVEGADEWAGKYVAAALAAGLIPEQSDYTVPASRQLLVEASYIAYESVSNEKWIKSAKQTGVRKVRIDLQGTFDPDATSVAIERIGEDGDRTAVGIESLEWDGGSAVTVVLSDDAEAGKYEAKLTIEQDGETAVYTFSYTVEPEQVSRVELGGADLLPRADNVEVPYILYNQYGELMSEPPADLKVDVASSADAKPHPDRQALLVNLAGWNENRVDIHLLVNEKIHAMRDYQVGDEPVVQSVETDGFADDAGAPVSSLKKDESAWLLLRPYDQYGNLITDLEWLNANLKAEETVNGRQSAKELAPGPGGAAAVRVTAGSYWVSTSITVTVRSLADEVLAQASITAESDPSLYAAPAPAPVKRAKIAVVPNTVVTFGDPNDLVSDVTASVYIASENVTTLYYAVVKDSEKEVPTADDLMNNWTPSELVRFPATVATDGEVGLVLELPPNDEQYILYVVGANDSGTLVSNVLAVEIDVDRNRLFNLYPEVIDATNPDDDHWTICLIHTPADATGTVYYIITDQPIYGYSPNDIVRIATSPDVPDDVSVGIVSWGTKDWNGMTDSILVDAVNGTHHVYVVLEYRRVRLPAEGEVTHPGI